MGIVLSWITANWFSLLQTLSIVGGLSFTGYTLLINARVRKVEMLLNVTQQHRTIWMKLIDSPHLKRVVDEKVDLRTHLVKKGLIFGG